MLYVPDNYLERTLKLEFYSVKGYLVDKQTGYLVVISKSKGLSILRK